MKKTRYYLALALTTATFSAAYANTEGQETWGQQPSAQHPSATWENVAQAEPTSNAEFVIAGTEVTITPGKNNTHTIQVATPSVVAKPHQGAAEKSFASKEFSKLWGNGGAFSKSNPQATLVWHKGQDQYELDLTISKAATGKKGITLTAVPTGAEWTFHKNGQKISQAEFFSAASEGGKEDVAVWINETTSEPTSTSPETTMHHEVVPGGPTGQSSTDQGSTGHGY